MTVEVIRALIGAAGISAAMYVLWYLDTNYDDFEKKLAIKVSASTLIFSIMMFTPFIDVSKTYIDFGTFAFPSLKLMADGINLGFLTSALKDIIEEDRKSE